MNFRTYYISTSGNNNNDGSITNPWLTLTYACSKATTPGDIIHINKGTFIETNQSILASGVSIKGEGIESIIKSNVGGTAFTILAGNSAEGGEGSQHISNIKMDGDNLTAYGAIYVYRRSNVKIYNCLFVNFNYWGVFYCGASAEGSEPLIYAVGNEFYNNSVINCSGFFPAGDQMSGEGKGALGLSGQDGLLIYNNTLDQTSRNGDSNGYLIKGRSYNKGIKIYDNIIVAGEFDNTTYDFAIELWDCTGGVEIYDNNITGAVDIAGTSTIKGDYPYAVYIHDNVIGRNVAQQYDNVHGIVLEQSFESIIIKRNYIKNVPIGIFIIHMVGSGFVDDDIEISYNIFDNLGVNDNGNILGRGSGIIFYAEDFFNHTINNLKIWNNIFIGHVGSIPTLYGIRLPAYGTSTNFSIKNNIIQGFVYSPVYSSAAIEGGVSIDHLSIENNLFYQNGNDNDVWLLGAVPTNYVNQNNLKSNPLFISSSDFHLQNESPCINTGIDIGLTEDYEGNPIIGVPDIGAYEKQ